jgi:hypothetical protein
MHTSFHLAQVQIPHTDSTLLLHTFRGAVDIIPREVALAVQDFDASKALLSEAETETLIKRGYLTEYTPRQELEQAHAVMRLSAKNFRRLVELTLRLPPAEAGGITRASEIEEVFSLASTIAGEKGMVAACLEILTPTVDQTVLSDVLAAALERGYPIMPTVSDGGLDAVGSWARSEYFNQLTLVTDASSGSDFEGLDAKITALFERQIHTSWTCRIDGMSAAQLEAILGVRERVRRKYANFIVYFFADEYDGTKAPGSINVSGVNVPFVSSENEAVLGTLLRLILMPTLVNYKPFFQPHTERLEVDLAENRLTYKAGPGRAFVGDLEGLHAQVEAGLGAHDGPEELWNVAQSATECLACKYSLLCGRDWIGAGRFPDARHCARSFEQRIAQTLPLLLFILRGNWRPPASANTQAGVS